jgi:hypothetical protein
MQIFALQKVFNLQLSLKVRRSMSDGKQIIIDLAERQAPYAYAVLHDDGDPWTTLNLREEELNLTLSVADGMGVAAMETTAVRDATVYVCVGSATALVVHLNVLWRFFCVLRALRAQMMINVQLYTLSYRWQ